MVGDVEHGVPEGVPLSGALGAVDGLGQAQPSALNVLRRPQAVKFQPDVLPGVVLAGGVGGHLAGADEKALPGLELIPGGLAVRAVGVQLAMAGDDIVKQEVIAHIGAEGVQRNALLPAILIQPQVHEILVGKKGKGEIIQNGHILSSGPVC